MWSYHVNDVEYAILRRSATLNPTIIENHNTLFGPIQQKSTTTILNKPSQNTLPTPRSNVTDATQHKLQPLSDIEDQNNDDQQQRHHNQSVQLSPQQQNQYNSPHPCGLSSSQGPFQ